MLSELRYCVAQSKGGDYPSCEAGVWPQALDFEIGFEELEAGGEESEP